MAVIAIINTDDFHHQMEIHLRNHVRQLTGRELDTIHQEAVRTFGLNGINIYLEEYQALLLKWMCEDGHEAVQPLTPWSIGEIKLILGYTW